MSGVRRTTDGLHQRQAAAQRGGPQLHRPQHRHGQGRRRGDNPTCKRCLMMLSVVQYLEKAPTVGWQIENWCNFKYTCTIIQFASH